MPIIHALSLLESEAMLVTTYVEGEDLELKKIDPLELLEIRFLSL